MEQQISEEVAMSGSEEKTKSVEEIISADPNKNNAAEHNSTPAERLEENITVPQEVDTNLNIEKDLQHSKEPQSSIPSSTSDPIDAGILSHDSDNTSDSDKATSQNEMNPPECRSPLQVPVQSTGLETIASQYQTDSEAEDDGNSSDSVEITTPSLQHRTPNVVISSSSDSDSDVEFVSQKSTQPKVVEIEDDEDEGSNKPKGPVRAKGELLLDDLPPIQDLHISIPEEECVILGKVHSIVEQLVLVDSLPGTAALDLDTVLFLEKGHKVLGQVFDVIGQVSNPLYCVRFNSNKQIKEKGIQISEVVYVAPRTEHTHFIILNNLTTIRGSDASWEDDVEPPEKHLDYSDDEEERNARRANRNRRQQTEETEATKKAKSSPRPAHQQGRFPRQRLPRGSHYTSEYSSDTSSQSSSYQYDSANTTWHANYNSPTHYPNPFARRSQHSTPEGNRRMYNHPSNYPQSSFNSSQESSHFPSAHNSPQFLPPNIPHGLDYSRAAFVQPPQPQMPFSPPHQGGQQFPAPNQQNPLFPGVPDRSQFAPSDYAFQAQFSSPPPPLPRQ